MNLYDENTKIITQNGIKKYHNLNKNDIVFSLNLNTGEIETNVLQNIYIENFNGNLIHVFGKRIDQLLSLNSSLIMQHDSKEYLITEISEWKKKLKPTVSYWNIPLPNSHGKLNEKINIKEYIEFNFKNELQSSNYFRNLKYEYSTKDFLYLLGLYIGDGFLASRKKINKNFSQHQRQKMRDKCGRFLKTDEIKDDKIYKQSSTMLFAIPESDPARYKLCCCLNQNDLKYTEQKATITVTSLPLAKVFSLSGNKVYFKKIPNFVFDFHPDVLKHLLKGLIDSDGSTKLTHSNKKRFNFSTVSDQLAAQMILLSMKCQKYCCYRETFNCGSKLENRIIKSTKLGYSIDINSGKTNKMYNKMLQEKKYNGKVWNLLLNKLNNFMTVRNGKVTFSKSLNGE